MKYFLFSILILLCTFASAQEISDTIYLKTGKSISVSEISRVENGRIYVYQSSSMNELSIDTSLVKKYTDRVREFKRQQTAKKKFEYAKSLEQGYYDNNKNKSEIDYKLGLIRYNLGEYYKEERTSQILYGIGFLSSTIGVYMISKQNNDGIAAGAIGGVFGLIGFCVHLDSYKWIKRATIEPVLNGISLNIKL